jgi:phage tail sheath gpL-like
MSSIVISGFTSAFKVPGIYMETVFGAGEISNASAPLKCLVVGLKGSTGTITNDGTPKLALSKNDVDALVQVGSEAARMAYQALRESGVQLWIACPAPAGGAVAATATITITSTPVHAATGEWRYRIGGIALSGATSTTVTQNALATAIGAAVNARTDLPVTATVSTNVVTLTAKCAGIRGNQYILMQDTTLLPSTISSAIAGGAAVTGGGVVFVNGAGTEDVTTLLSTMSSTEFAQNDTTNLPIIETWLNNQSAWDVGILQLGVVGLNTSLSAATTLATVTMNAERLQLLAMQNGESHPSEMAARWTAHRSVFEQSDPAASSQYDGFALTGIAPQTTHDNGDAVIIRSITTKCLSSSVADFRTLGTERASAPDFARRGIYRMGVSFIANNPRVQDDPGTGERPPKPGIAFPALWTKTLTKYAYDLAEGAANVVSSGLPVITDVANNLPFSQFDPIANRIMFVFPAEIANGNHQLGGQIRQTNNG